MLVCVIQSVQQVRQRLGVHQAMFQRDVNQLLRHMVHPPVQFLSHLAVVVPDFIHARPIRRLVGGERTLGRIDSKLEELIKSRMEGTLAERLARDQVPIEGLQMPKVKDEPVPLGNGPLVLGVRTDDFKQAVGRRPCFTNLLDQFRTRRCEQHRAPYL